MEPISVRRAWATGTARVRERWHEMLAIAVLTGTLPGLVQFLAVGDSIGSLASQLQGTSDPLGVAQIGAASLFASILSVSGYMLAWRRLAAPEAAWGATVAYAVGATIAIGVLGMLVGALFFGVVGVGLAGIFAGAATGEPPILFAFTIIPLMMVGMFWLLGRLCVTGPAMADVPTYNLFKGMATSWRLTRRSQWKLAGYIFVVGIISGIVSSLAGGAALLSSTSLQELTQPSWEVMLGSLLVQIPVFLLWIVVAEGLYREAVGTPDIAEVFA